MRNYDSNLTTLRTSQPLISGMLEAYFKDRDQVTFLQIGANDGISSDPLRPILKHSHHWQGTFVEPLDPLASQIESLYKGDSRFTVLRCAVDSSPGRKKFFFIKPEAGKLINNPHAHLYSQIGSLDRDHLLKHQGNTDLKDWIEETEVDCLTPAELIGKLRIEKLSLLHLDTEGRDGIILAKFPYDKVKPEIIVFESRHLQSDVFRQTCSILAEKGYQLVRLAHDAVAYLQETSIK